MKVRDVMTRQVATVRPDAPLKDIARLLAKCRAGVVYVVGERGAPVGHGVRLRVVF